MICPIDNMLLINRNFRGGRCGKIGEKAAGEGRRWSGGGGGRDAVKRR